MQYLASVAKLCVCLAGVRYCWSKRTRYKILGAPIGGGKFCSVSLALCTTRQTVVVVKSLRMNVRAVVQRPLRRSFEREVHILRYLQGAPNIVSYIDHYGTSAALNMVLEYCEHPDLLQHIQHHGAFDEDTAIPLFLQMLNTLRFLHSQHIVHRDIKPENFVYNPHRATVTWIDFGHAKMGTSHKDTQRMTTNTGTLYYNAPELLNSYLCYDGCSVDVWALGVTLYVILFMRFPFEGYTCQELRIHIFGGLNLFGQELRSLCPWLCELFVHVFEIDSTKRWGTTQLIDYIYTHHSPRQMTHVCEEERRL